MKSKTILSADEMLEILNSQWATVQDIMKIGAVGRNKARDIKNKISEEIILLNTSSSRYIEYNKVKNSIRDELSKYLIKETGNKPMIITVMQEI